jgi:hypothetical protein
MVLGPLIKVGKDGVEMTCPDGYVRLVFPVLAAYIADYPEQCKIGCIDQHRCPRCAVPPKEMGDHDVLVHTLLREADIAMSALKLHRDGVPNNTYTKMHLKPIYKPFWEKLPHCNVYACITPNILHKGHGGMFWTHLESWCANIVGKAELDSRFKVTPLFARFCRFKKGVSLVLQWTCSEFKEMEKVFVGVMAGACHEPTSATSSHDHPPAT